MKRDVLKKLFLNIMFYGVMFLYALILFFLLFKKKSVGSFQTINLIPFRTIIDYLFNEDVIVRSFAFSNIMGNIAIFIPLGIYIPLLINKKSIFTNSAIVALISLCVEIVQYILAIGTADVDDIILNTIGGLLGILIFKLVYLIFKDKSKVVITFLTPIGGVIAVILLFLLNN